MELANGVQCWRCARSQGLDKGVLLVYGGSWVVLLWSGRQLGDSRLVRRETNSLCFLSAVVSLILPFRLLFYPALPKDFLFTASSCTETAA